MFSLKNNKIADYFKKIKPMALFRRFLYIYKNNSQYNIEIDYFTSIKVKNLRSRLYFEKKYCLVPKFYYELEKNSDNTVEYNDKKYSLKKVTVLENGNETDFINKDGSQLYEIIGLKDKKENNSNFVLWIKDGKITNIGDVLNNNFIETSFSGEIKKPFSLQSVNPRTQKTNWVVTIFFTHPVGFIAKGIRYFGFRIPEMILFIVNCTFKLLSYGCFLIGSFPFLWSKNIREMDKRLLSHFINKRPISLNEIKNHEIAKKDESLSTKLNLKILYLPVLIENTLLNIVKIPLKLMSYSLNMLSSFIEGCLNMFNAFIYSDNSYFDIAKAQIKHSICGLKDKSMENISSLALEIKSYIDINKISSCVNVYEGVDNYTEELGVCNNVDVFNTIQFQQASNLLKKNDVTYGKGVLSYYSEDSGEYLKPIANQGRVHAATAIAA